MALTETELSTWRTGSDPRVVISCKCSTLHIRGVAPYNGTTVAAAAGRTDINVASTDTADVFQLDEMLDAINDGDAEVWYLDGRNFVEYDDLPLQHAIMHTRHQFHPPNRAGGLALDHMIESGDYDGSADSHQFLFGGFFRTRRSAPLTDTIIYPVREFQAVPTITDNSLFNLETRIPSQLVMDADGLDTYAPILAFREFMEGNRDAGATVGTDFSALTTWGSRDYQFTFADSTTLDFTISSLIADTNDDGHYIRFGLQCRVDSDGDYDVNPINALLDTDEQTISSTGVELNSPLGDYQNSLRGNELDFGGDQGVTLREENGSLVTHFTDSDGDNDIGIVAGNTRIIAYDDLPNDGTDYYVPKPSERPLASIIRVSGKTLDVTVTIDSFQELAQRPNNARPFQVHNHNTTLTALVNLVDSIGNVVTLNSGEHGEFVASFNSDGSGRLIGHVPPRVLEHRHVNDGSTMGSMPYVEVNSDNWGRVLPLDTAGRFDGDAYDLGASSYTNGTAVANVIGQSDLPTGAFRIEKPGQARFRQEFAWEPQSTASGNWSEGNGIRLYRYRDGTATQVHRVRYPEYSPAIGTRDYLFVHETDDIEVNDRYLFVFSYPKVATLTQHSMVLTGHHRRIVLDQHIERTHTPS